MCTCLTSLLTCFLSKKAHGALQLRVINNASELLIKTELLYARTVSLRDKTKPHIIQFNLLLVIHLAKQTQNLSERAKPYVGIAFIFVILKINYKPVNTCTLASNKLNRISLFETRNSYSMRQSLKDRTVFGIVPYFKTHVVVQSLKSEYFTQLLFFGLSLATASSCSYMV